MFVAGNHELWCQQGADGEKPRDSIVKLQQVIDVCDRLRVHTQPLIVELEEEAGMKREDGGEGLGKGAGERRRLVLLPLQSWYHSSFDTEPELPPEVLQEVPVHVCVLGFRVFGLAPVECVEVFVRVSARASDRTPGSRRLSLSLVRSLALSLSLARSCCLSRSLALALSISLSLSLSRARALSPARSLSCVQKERCL
jgi:hypothetical protein